MNIGLGIGLNFSLGGALAAQIAALFSSGQNGAWLDPGDFTTLFQDAAGTTPVTAVEQPVGLMRDKSGRNNHLSQATAAARPLVRVDGGSYNYLNFDGVDDFLTSATGGGATTGFFWCGVVDLLTLEASQTLFGDAIGNNGHIVRVSATGQLQFYGGNGTVYNGAFTADAVAAGIKTLLTVWNDGVNNSAQINSGSVASVAHAATAAGTAGFTVFVDNGGSSNRASGKLYPFIYRTGPVVTAAERATIQAYCKAKAGL